MLRLVWERLTEVAFSPRWWLVVAVVVGLAEVVLNAVVVAKVPYTEIDYTTYCQQVALVSGGERNYLALRGDTGPCPYPAGYVWAYTALCSVADGTDGVASLLPIQIFFAGLHVATYGLVAYIYSVAGRAHKHDHPALKLFPRRGAGEAILPPLVLVLLAASHRIHSIFALRLFNDPVAMFFVYASIAVLVSRGSDYLVMALFSLGVSVKMNALLFAPALGIIMVKRVGMLWTIPRLAVAAAVQVGLAWPFLTANAEGYIGRAFDLSRVFEYKWTVNLKFLPEPIFVSKTTAAVLLAGHAGVLALFILTRWLHAQGGGLAGVWRLLRTAPPADAPPLSPYHMVRMLFVSNFIGVVFARTLHYQFYSWYFHTLPFLLWATPLPLVARLAIFAAIEYAFNVFPATTASSGILAAAHTLLLVGLFVGPAEGERLCRHDDCGSRRKLE
ncbi:glycosyltransferase family 58 protein [Thecamonas trahens ATCC 50062]|uniref:dolichyl-P-Man:Man5GlcNAc2-PP-dolichol alpha-1,3-mannosyltransferase n=1 Tax=Thecamonas trahens ATCC 50062 TaxID=461836 RepID=A0A0L0DTA0_THETB|nr:glycosyltransferase family 58 protein [Thecamonas trahens ATCC 50062]KNC54668.1 glycosyltransferase family 58 protein [Thecamonas trahens ATCC 50062]|eukprot:XP_013761570.1 glycosyltransferase family 58 protein [Thecamonas trahens ATCC 50062]